MNPLVQVFFEDAVTIKKIAASVQNDTERASRSLDALRGSHTTFCVRSSHVTCCDGLLRIDYSEL